MSLGVAILEDFKITN